MEGTVQSPGGGALVGSGHLSAFSESDSPGAGIAGGSSDHKGIGARREGLLPGMYQEDGGTCTHEQKGGDVRTRAGDPRREKGCPAEISPDH